MTAIRLFTLDLLVRDRVIDINQANIVLAQQRHQAARGTRRSVGELLVENRFASQSVINTTVQQTAGAHTSQQSGNASILPIGLCLRYRLIPLRVQDSVLVVRSDRALLPADESEIIAQANEYLVTDQITSVRSTAAPRNVIEAELSDMRRVQAASLPESIARLEEDLENGELMSAVLAELFVTAASRRASDIHIQWDEHTDTQCWITFRIDGLLRRQMPITRSLAAALTRRIKDISDMDASESRRSQDGRHSFPYLSRVVDVRVAAQPTLAGENLFMRLLDPATLRSLDDLFPGQDDICNALRDITQVRGKEGGIVVVSGATGQGKTTTLYAMISALPRHQMHVVTIEDPVEFKFPFTTQIQYNPSVHESMAQIMKSVMREDPDIIVVGETRDADTTVLALRAAESGHLILTTLHTTDCFQIYERLISLHPGGEKEALLPLANNLQGSMHQVLALRICPHCSTPVDVPSDHPLRGEGVTSAYIGRGCDHCMQSGYQGRVAVPEAIFISKREETRQEVINHLRAEGSLRTMKNIPGVRIFRRNDAVRDLVSKGLITCDWGSRILGLSNA